MVLDEEDGQIEALARLGDEARQPLDFLVAQAAGRLVEQQQPGLGDEGARELDSLQRRVRQP